MIDERVNLLGLSLAKLSMLGSSNSSWTERERRNERLSKDRPYIFGFPREFSRVWSGRLISGILDRANGSFFLWKRETGTVGRKERNVIGDDCTWSIEPTNEEPSARANSEAPPFFIFFLISRHLYVVFRDCLRNSIPKYREYIEIKWKIFDGKIKGRVFRGRSERFSDFSFHAVQTKLHSAHSEWIFHAPPFLFLLRLSRGA